MKHLLPVGLFLLFVSLPLICFSQEELIPVTALQFSKKAPKGERWQIRPSGPRENDSLQIWGFNFYSLPKRVKKIIIPESKEKIARVLMRKNAESSLDSTYVLLRDTSNAFKSKPPQKQTYELSKEKFLDRKKSSVYFKNQWVRLGSLRGMANENFYFSTRGFLRKRATYHFDFLPGAVAGQMPALDPWNCVPVEERFFRLRKLQGYGLNHIPFKHYDAPKRQVIRKNFDVYFPVNSTEPDHDQLQAVIEFLRSNHYEILNATLEGGCSAEGDSARNVLLQVNRARVLSRALKQYNNNPVSKDTVMLSNTFVQFRELLRYSDFKALDSLNNTDLRNKINRDDNLQKALEPIFVVQRKASLALVMAKAYTHDERLIKVRSELLKWCAALGSRIDDQKKVEAHLMGLLEFLFQQYIDHAITEKYLEDAIVETGVGDYLYALLGYHLIKQFEEKYLISPTGWSTYWTKYNIEGWFNKCQDHLIAWAQGFTSTVTLIKYKRMLADYQAYSFRFIQLGLMDINSLCNVQYPSSPAFINFQLYRYGFLYEMATRYGKEISCVGIPSRVTANPKDTKDSVTNVDAFVDRALQEMGIKNSIVLNTQGPRMRKPSFNNAPKSAYYVILREKFVLGHDYVMNAVEYVDSGQSVELDVFNLAHLIMPNIDGWDPGERHFYDRLIQLDELDKLISKLKKMGTHICPPQINQIFLDYHLKALYYLENYFEPGSEKQTKIAEASLKYICDYYKSRSKAVSPKLSLHIVRQFNKFNWLPGTKAGAWYGYDLLKEIAKKRILNDEELKLYAHYIRLYDPEFKIALPPGFDKEQLIRLGKEKYNFGPPSQATIK